MIVDWDRAPGKPGLIWDDENECCYSVFPNAGGSGRGGDIQEYYPFITKVIPYEMIQYIDILMPPNDAFNYIKKHKGDMSGTEEDLNIMYSDAIGRRSYTGTISDYPHRAIRKPLSSE